MIATIHLSDEHTPQPIPPVNDDDDDDDDEVKPGSGGGNIDPDDDEGEDDDEDDDEETLWTLRLWRGLYSCRRELTQRSEHARKRERRNDGRQCYVHAEPTRLSGLRP